MSVPRVRSARPHALLIVNPRASRATETELAAVTRSLRGAYSLSVAHTEARGHATALARDAAGAGYDLVVVAGGDGTVGEAAGGLADSGTPLACLPSGCTNVFARALGGPRRQRAAAERLTELAQAGPLVARPVDLGLVNGRPFACNAGVGFPASMTALADLEPEGKAIRGQLHFARAAASELWGRYLRRPPLMHVEAAGRAGTGVTLVAQNAHTLTYFGAREIRACEVAGLDTGTISLTLLRRARPLDVAEVVARLLSGRPIIGRHPQVEGFASVAEAVVVAADGHTLPVEADGEYLGEFGRVEFGVAPAALRVVG